VSTLVYIVGVPGAGKSTLMAALTAEAGRHPQTKPFAHTVLLGRQGAPVGAELGRRRETFSGTDALAMNVQPKATQWLAERPYPLILGEGMRLGTIGFLEAAAGAGYAVKLVHLEVPEETAAQRRAQRGSNQDEKWLKAARTRVGNLVARLGEVGTLVPVNGEANPASLVWFLTQEIPELEVLR
jgi:ribose 1,5-bisphosphokinase PhnN